MILIAFGSALVFGLVCTLLCFCANRLLRRRVQLVAPTDIAARARHADVEGAEAVV